MNERSACNLWAAASWARSCAAFSIPVVDGAAPAAPIGKILARGDANVPNGVGKLLNTGLERAVVDGKSVDDATETEFVDGESRVLNSSALKRFV